MSQLINVSIDVTKINKSRLHVGKKGKYLNLTIEVRDAKDQYGNDVKTWEGQSEEERKAKADRNYLGDGRVVWTGQSKSQNPAPPADIDNDDDVPF